MTELSHVGMTNCFYCGQGASIVIHKRLRQVLSRNMGVADMEPCSECKGFMKRGIIVIVVEKASLEAEIRRTSGMPRDQDRPMAHIPNPKRSGLFTVITEDGLRRLFGGPAGVLNPKQTALLNSILRVRWTFMDDEAAEHTGLAEMVRRQIAESEKQSKEKAGT